eukprot:gnl/Chilomastix_caulleri/2187.p1 GENE.gnl/Chilomastix_caulleri/2187~~gnl/Chilomastix_caulleri/2187.p1  ORF type:complete len:53 (+),score=1.03 gnl/Chilomastix_caulleri/2187:47-205(+)
MAIIKTPNITSTEIITVLLVSNNVIKIIPADNNITNTIIGTHIGVILRFLLR